MKSILIIGEESRTRYLKGFLNNNGLDPQISDGDEEEDFKEFDIIFDLNFDDDSENFPIYAGLKDKLIFLSSVKQSLSEAAYTYSVKVRSRIFGINAIDHYLKQDVWELSAYRGNEWSLVEEFMKSIQKSFIQVEDSIGMYRPRIDFLRFNECITLLEKGVISSPLAHGTRCDFEWIDQIGATDIFETLTAIYEDTKDIKYNPVPLLKRKYLRNHRFIHE